VQERVRAEAIGRVPTADDASRLTYTTMVLKETMRLYPSAPLVGRRAVADDEIAGYLITAGSGVVTVPWITHRHPAFWASPQSFDPSRFTPAAEKARDRYAWHPFGGGPRACIGQRFSMLRARSCRPGWPGWPGWPASSRSSAPRRCRRMRRM
jgi:cytochrome P450